MIRRILGNRRPTTPSLASISLEEELALLRVELMYGLRVNREAYLRRKMEEREEVVRRMHHRDAQAMLADLRGRLERVKPQNDAPRVIDLRTRRHLRPVDGPETA
ncbi:hypothetical protein ACWENQ_21820 [Nonomuraea sp. NPDC004354]|uniref:hypothetical protein n=1 Tax=Nonomuraea sp. NPDC003804 TaxID=3154547 RepID=UPI0033B80F30